MPITADLSRSDLLLVCPVNPEQVVVVAQAQPHSISSLYDDRSGPSALDRQGCARYPGSLAPAPAVAQSSVELLPGGAPVRAGCLPDPGQRRQVAGAAQHRDEPDPARTPSRNATSRSGASIEWLKAMCLRGELATRPSICRRSASRTASCWSTRSGASPTSAASPTTCTAAWATWKTCAASGLPYLQYGRRRAWLRMRIDHRPAASSARSEEGAHIWIRKVLPVVAAADAARAGGKRLAARAAAGSDDVGGVLIMVHDATEERRKRQELEVKTTMIQEVHHRVKNNLQTIAAVLRMQARRTQERGTHAGAERSDRPDPERGGDPRVPVAGREPVHQHPRCLPADRWRRAARSAGRRGSRSTSRWTGRRSILPSQQATACALVINELIQNARGARLRESASGARCASR